MTGATERQATARTSVSRRAVIAGALVVLVAAIIGVAAFAASGSPSVPSFRHVYLIVLENKSSDVVGQAPYLKELAARYGLASDYSGIAHPSQPNYIALFSGSTQGVTDDTPVDLHGQNLADQLEAHGKTWRTFAENFPGNCFTGDSASGGPDGPGTYVRRHVPPIEFTDITGSARRCANVTNLSVFDPGVADFELIVPNMCHDMHDCPVQAGDAFLRSFVPKILDSPAWKQGGVLFITFDESSDFTGSGGGSVATLVVSPSVPAGFRSSTHHDHYSLLRTIEDVWGLGCLGQTCSANTLGEFFH